MERKGETQTADVEARVQARRLRHWSGVIVTVGGVAVALLNPDHVLTGLVVALIGAGLVEPSAVLGIFRR